MCALNMVILAACILLSVAFFTLMERKYISITQIRKGPAKTGIAGLLQPISDAVKLMTKELVVNNRSNMNIYLLAPMMNLVCSMMMWFIYPFFFEFKFMKMSSLFMVSCMSFNVMTVMLMAWSSNSNYSFIGMMRTISQLISYEINFLIGIILVVNVSSHMNYQLMQQAQKYWPIWLSLLPVFVLWLIIILAETNRTPFDFAEGESELISGFNIEYASSSFVFLFLAEYSGIMMMSLTTILMFTNFGVSSFMFYICYMIINIFFIWTRSSLPRFRYDKLMKLSWTQILPWMTLILYMSFVYKMYCTMMS